MIDVTIQPMGRSLLAMGFGALKYKAVMQQKEYQLLTTQFNEVNRLQEESNFLADLSFDLTSNMIDKRFNSSKEYTATGGLVPQSALQFKKSTTKSDRQMVQLTQQTALKTRTRYNKAVSSYNRQLQDRKIKTSLSFIDIKKYI